MGKDGHIHIHFFICSVVSVALGLLCVCNLSLLINPCQKKSTYLPITCLPTFQYDLLIPSLDTRTLVSLPFN